MPWRPVRRRTRRRPRLADRPAFRVLLALAILRRYPDSFDRAAQAFGVIAAIEMSFPRRFEPLFGRVAPCYASGLRKARVGFARDASMIPRWQDTRRSRDAAIRNDRALVGRHGHCAASIIRETYGPGNRLVDLRRLDRTGDRVRRVCAGIDVTDAFDAQQFAVCRRVSSDLIVMFAAIRVAAEMFSAVLQPANRMVYLLASQPSATSSRHRTPLYPKPPPTSGEMMRSCHARDRGTTEASLH